MVYYVEETLQSASLPTGGWTVDDLIPQLIYGEVMEGARKPLLFIQAVREDFSILSSSGTRIAVPIMSQLTARTGSEATIDSAGYTADDVTMTDISVTIGNEVYSAIKLSRILLENQPNIDWLRLHLRNMGAAVMEYLDGAIRDALVAGANSTRSAATAQTLTFKDIALCVADMKKIHWFPEEGNPFLFFVHPTNAIDVLASYEGSSTYGNGFISTARYTTNDLTKIVQGETGLIAGCKVMETSNMTLNLALVVAPPTHRFGPNSILAWKRRLDVVTKAQEDYARTMYITSIRYGVAVINAKAIVLLSNC